MSHMALRVLVLGVLMGCTAPAPVSAGPFDGGAVIDAGAVVSELDGVLLRYVGDGGVTVAFPGGVEMVDQLPAVVVGVIRRGAVEVASRSRPGAPTLNRTTVLPLSSISKAVTGLIAAKGIVEGRFQATMPASTLLAADLSGLAGDRTLVELASHTAGYLANPRNLDVATMPTQPAAAYTRERLALCLSRPDCSVAPSQRGTYVYSNLSPGLLGLALADQAGVDFETLVQTRLARPLGLVDTHVRAASDLSRTVPGLTPTGETVQPAAMGALAAAGELLSTTDDVLVLLAQLTAPAGEWQAPIELAVAPTTSTGAIGWCIDRLRIDGRLRFSKTGEQAGYSSIVMWSPAEGTGVVAFTTVGRSSRTLAGLASELFDGARDGGP